MMNTLDALPSSLRNKTKKANEQDDQGSKENNNDPVYELLQFCSNFAKRMADIPIVKSREIIRHAMEMAIFEHKIK